MRMRKKQTNDKPSGMSLTNENFDPRTPTELGGFFDCTCVGITSKGGCGCSELSRSVGFGMCRAYGKSFRRVVLLCVVLLGVYAIFFAVYYSSNRRLPLYESDRSYFGREYGRGVSKDGGKDTTSEKRGFKDEQSIEPFTLNKQNHVEEKLLFSSNYKSLLIPPSLAATTTTTVSAIPSLSTSPSSFSTTEKPIHSSISSAKPTNSRVLLLYDQLSLSTAKEIRILLQAHRVPHDVYLYSRDYLLPLEDSGKGRYCTIIFSDCVSLYFDWSESHRQYILNHARTFGVTFISFFNPDRLMRNITGDDMEIGIGNLFIWLATNSDILGVSLNNDADFYYLKTGEPVTKLGKNTTYAGIHIDGSKMDSNVGGVEMLAEMKFKRRSWYRGRDRLPIVVAGESGGLWAGITQVMVGMPISFWMTKLIFLEVMRSYSKHRNLARFGRERLVMVDVDDIFVAPKGSKMTPADVEHLVDAQNGIREMVPGFTFNLGICGQYFNKGTSMEINGSQSLVRNSDHFWWFGHMYSHQQPHLLNTTVLRSNMVKNVEFARNFSLPIKDNHYSVSPHHSGIYPVHEPLYQAWKSILNVSVTSTEEYPHLYPPHRRRGFVHRGIMVLPRQTCRLFTHNYNFSNFPGGRHRLDSLAQGGEVFNYLLNNPVVIYMTHMSNYAQDRLAPYLFTALFKFVSRWTKLDVSGAPPMAMARKYFSIFPEDTTPIWTCPCRDKRHMDIWRPGQNCTRLPNVLVLGPQKSGTTALHMFLRNHPHIAANKNTANHFEEVQFFTDFKLYSRGISWYMAQFPEVTNSTQVLFEKSATYFTHGVAPARVRSMLPEAKLIIILHDPTRRAYSWYQHMRSHEDPTAMTHSFMEVLRANASSPAALRHLRDHCLDPGKYYSHILHWLTFFPASQLWFVDGVRLQLQPIHEMNKLQQFLGVTYVNYSSLIAYNQRKRHYCAIVSGKFECLGPSKGRRYRTLQPNERAWLRNYYSNPNLLLSNILTRMGRQLPLWLINSKITHIPVRPVQKTNPG